MLSRSLPFVCLFFLPQIACSERASGEISAQVGPIPRAQELDPAAPPERDLVRRWVAGTGEERASAERELAGRGASVIPAIVQGLRGADMTRAHVRAATFFAQLGPAAIPELTRLLNDGDPKIRLVAAQALVDSGIDHPAVRSAFERARRDASAKVRVLAELGLEQIRKRNRRPHREVVK